MFKKILAFLFLIVLSSGCFQTYRTTKVEQSNKSMLELAMEVQEKMPDIATVPIAYVDSEDTPLASVRCTNDVAVCMIEVNVAAMQRAGFLYGQKVVIWILAHEMGHIRQFIDGTVYTVDSKKLELGADRYAGCVLALMSQDSDLEDFAMSSLHESSTHPAPELRLKAIEEGYKSCE